MNRFIINKGKRFKDAKKHILRIVFFELLLTLVALWKGLFTSENNAQTIIVTVIFLLFTLYTVYIINKYYKTTLNSIEFIDSKYYLLTYSKWFSRNYTIQVNSEKINFLIDKIDPNSGTIAYSSLLFYDENTSYKFEVVLEDLKNILIFCWSNKRFDLTMNEIWDIKEISNYKGFEELKRIL